MFQPQPFSHRAVEVGNALSLLCAEMARSDGGELSVIPADRRPAMALRIDLGIGEEKLALFTDAQSVAVAARHAWKLGADYSLPDSLMATIMERALGPLVQRIEEVLHTTPVLQNFSDAEDLEPAAMLLPFSVRLASGEVVHVAFLLEDSFDQACLPPLSMRSALLPMEALDLSFPLVAGSATLTLAELRALAPGDIILTPRDGPAGTSRVRLHPGPALCVIGEIDDSVLIVNEVLHGQTLAGWELEQESGDPAAADNEKKEMEAMADPEDETDEEVEAGGEVSFTQETIDEVPVKLVFTFGELPMTIGQLKSLAPGQSFALGRELSAALDINLNGRRIGSGEIIDIEGRLGVRVTGLIGHDG